MELRDLLAVAWKRRFVVSGVLAVSVALATALALTRAPTYEATATLALTPDVARGQGFIAPDAYSALLGTYAEAAKSAVIRRRAQAELGRPVPGRIDTETVSGTGILRVVGRAEDPQDAAAAAGATARAFRESIAGNRLVVATLITPAAAPDTPVQPRPPLIIGTAALLGLLAGILLAFATENLRRRVQDAPDLAELTDAPVVGRLPRERALSRGPARAVWGDPLLAGLQEAFRALRTNVEFVVDDATRMVQVTSAEPEQGKSTVVANLAIALAHVGTEILVVDADMRRPRQHEIFGLDNRTGLSTLLASPSDPPPIRSTEYPRLRVLPAGPAPAEPTDLLHIRFPAVAAALRRAGALVLIDTPPVLPVSDARLVAPETDGVLLVVASGAEKPSALRHALERLDLVGARIVGVVLNQSGDDLDDRGGAYYRGVRLERRELPSAPGARDVPSVTGAS